MKKLIFIFLTSVGFVNVSAYTITQNNSDDGIHYTFVGHCDGNGVFQGNSTPSINEAYVCGPKKCFHAKSRDTAIKKACEVTKAETSTKYGYVKSKAYLFKKRTGDGSINWALTPAPGKVPHMDKIVMDSMMGGKYAVPRNADANIKVILLKKYADKKLLQSYWKVKTGSGVFYILDKDIKLK